MLPRLSLCVFASVALAGSRAWGGAIMVSPLRVELNARHPVPALDVRTEGSEPVIP